MIAKILNIKHENLLIKENSQLEVEVNQLSNFVKELTKLALNSFVLRSHPQEK